MKGVIMKKLILLSIMCLLVCFGLENPVAADDGVDVDIVCPASVKAGTALSVTVYPHNEDCYNSYTFTRGMAGLGGNNSTKFALGFLGLYGPFEKKFSSWLIPQATCDQYGNLISPGTGETRTITIVNAVPSTLVNTMAMTMFGFVDADGKPDASDACFVTVVP
jgi:hypothetical protein